ncbi:MBL fold metallo-hydrolase [Mycobacteroides chelonae]|uniref:MBL fold metallo-hydrolase n=1 Tax=Mycobacteroides chelonae TaxID=1774 RepID=UPI001F1CCB17|nr:MBL fold metallo-hydrolase [Mycobacteroides chelonae]
MAEAGWYRTSEVAGMVTCYTEPYADSIVSANIWHLRGPDRDLVFDTGLGVASLKSALPELFEREPVAFVSHWHLDHSGGAHEFSDVRIHRQGVSALNAPPEASLKGAELARELGINDQLADTLLTAIPYADYDIEKYRVRPVSKPTSIPDRARIDLGGKTALTIVHMPGHTRDSSVAFDERTGDLFAGDVVYEDPENGLLDYTSDSSVGDYVRSLTLLKDMKVARVHPGHGSTFDGAVLSKIIEQYLAKHR